ncbi:MAG: hypothetical protein OXE85_04155 [Roseovarius sp.]|nr:hypothetical protein [Roseovarius sp.]
MTGDVLRSGFVFSGAQAVRHDRMSTRAIAGDLWPGLFDPHLGSELVEQGFHASISYSEQA